MRTIDELWREICRHSLDDFFIRHRDEIIHSSLDLKITRSDAQISGRTDDWRSFDLQMKDHIDGLESSETHLKEEWVLFVIFEDNTERGIVIN